MPYKDISAITYEELNDSPQWSGGETGTRCIRRFRVQTYTDWRDFIANLMGVYRVSTAAGGTKTVAYTPERLKLPGWPAACVSDWTAGPWPDHGKADQSGKQLVQGSMLSDLYEHQGGALVTATYDTAFSQRASKAHPGLTDSLIPVGTFLKYDVELGGDVMLTPKGSWRWGSSSGTPADEIDAGIVIPSIIHTLTWHWVALPPFKKWRTHYGAVNSSTFLGAPAECVLFLGGRCTGVWRFQDGSSDTDGASGTEEYPVLYRIEYRFAETVKYLRNGTTQVGHNYYWNKDGVSSENWVKLVNADNISPLRTANFTDLFQYGDGTV